MGLRYRRRVPLGKAVTLNLSRSLPSVSTRAGRFTLNSRGRGSIRLGRGFSYTFRWLRR